MITKIVLDEVAKTLQNDEPLRLDQSAALAPVPDLIGFHPKHITVRTADDLNRPLPPGDYSVDVTAYCTQWSIHAPGRGLPYKIARVQGKQADIISALIVRGSLQNISSWTLNRNAWRIQAGTPLDDWPSEEQALVHKLIPEYEKRLQGDYLQQIKKAYDKAAKIPRMFRQPVPPFEEILQSAELGRRVLGLWATRKILADRAIEANHMPERLYQATGDGSPYILAANGDESPSSWTEIQPGVIARYTIQEGNMARNLFEFRILPKDGKQPAASADLAATTAPNAQQAATAEGKTAGEVLGMGKPVGQASSLYVGYSVGRGAQALIPVSQPDPNAIEDSCPDLNGKYDFARYVDSHEGELPCCVKDEWEKKYVFNSNNHDGFWFAGSDEGGHYYLMINPLGLYTDRPEDAMQKLKKNLETLFPLGGAKDKNNVDKPLIVGHSYLIAHSFYGVPLPLGPFEVQCSESSAYHFTFVAKGNHILQGSAIHGIFKDKCGQLWMFQQGRGVSNENWVSNVGSRFVGYEGMWNTFADNLKGDLGN